MDIAEAQRDLRRAYVGGGPGALVSGLVWFAAAFVEARRGVPNAFTMLFFGGFLIFPVSTLLCRFAFGRAKEAVGNPFGMIALESTIAMIGGLFAAWLFIGSMPEYVFPLAAIAVGTHYAAFRSAYGDMLFWILAAIITAIGVFDILNYVNVPGGTIFAVGIVEIVFGVVLTMRALKAR
jgi:hypothetical protein